VARAATAAPLYFAPVAIEDRTFLDGGFGSSNPSWEIYNEVRDMHNQSADGIEILLSIGTGETAVARMHGFMRTIAAMVAAISDTRQVDENLRSIMRPDQTYFRINVETLDLSRIKLDEWKQSRKGQSTTADQILTLTTEYLNRVDVAKRCERIAEILVDRRRQRATTSRWEQYALGVRYRCHVRNCSEGPTWRRQEELALHLQNDHNFGPPARLSGNDLKEYNDLMKLGRYEMKFK
jgi:hypothetical protein